MLKDYRREYCFKFLCCKAIKPIDISNNTDVAQSSAYFYKQVPKRILKAKREVVDDMFIYFKSLGLDEDNLKNVTRETVVEFIQR